MRRLATFTLGLLLLLIAPAAAQNVKDAPVLAPGQAVERTLTGGQSHTYLVTLSSGQLLHVEVNQRGIDVVVTLFGPDGRQLAEVDSPNGTQGPESVWLIAETPGSYRLVVRSLEQTAAAGRYEMNVAEVRDATAQDRARLAAQQSEREVEQLFARDTPEALREAIEKAEQTLKLWRAAGDHAKEVFLLTGIGKIYIDLSEHRQAREYLTRALSLARATNDQNGEALALILLTATHKFLGENEEALAAGQRALSLVRATRNQETEIIALRAVAQLLSDQGEKQQALNHLEEALRLSIATKDAAGEAMTLNNMAVVYHELGEYEKALYYSKRALPFTREADSRAAQAQALANIGGMYTLIGRREEALASLREALALSRAGTEPNVEASVLNNLGTLHFMAREYPQALAVLQQSLALARTIKSHTVESLALYNLGQTHSGMGQYQQALEYLNLALPLWREAGDRSYESQTLAAIANAERKEGSLDSATAHIKAALEIAETLRTKVSSAELRASYFASVQSYYEIYIDLLMRQHERRPTEGLALAALQVSERARARSLLEMLVEANADIRQGIDPALLTRERTLQEQLNTKAQQQTRLLGKSKSPEAPAQQTNVQAQTLAAEIERLTAELQQARGQIRQASPRYDALTQPQPLSAGEIQRQVLDEDTLLLEYALGSERSYLWVLSPDSFTSYELPKRAEIETVARQFYELSKARPRRRSKASVRRGQGGEPQQQTDARLARAAAQLSRLLLTPVASQLGRKRLLIVSDGVLQYIPFGALPAPPDKAHAGATEPLITKHEIVYLPSASTLAVLRREAGARKNPTRTLAVLADPVFERDDERLKGRVGNSAENNRAGARPTDASRDRDLIVTQAASESGIAANGLRIPRLPGTRREADAIVKLVSPEQAKVALDFNASRTIATSAELGEYRYVHFATHGFLNSQHPELSGIVFSMFDEEGVPRDGFLRAHEVFNLKLAADVVVLSACQTGLGKEVKGEGLVGLTRGFMYAGAPRVVVSLWSVNDAATAELMTRFYRGLLVDKLRPGQALQAAQVSMLKDKHFAAPFYWAAFTLQGEWR